MPVPIQFHHISKRYQLGAQHHSLRDAIPAFVRRVTGRASAEELKEGEFWALKDVTFEVAKGETVGLIGRNGAGKSTALKLLSNISKPTQGTLKVEGRLAALIEVGAGFHPDLTGRENVYLNGTILGMKRHEVRALFDQIVSFAELESFIDTPVKRYSSGMFVRLGFSVAAHVNPDVLLIDEVLAVGDMAFQQKCMQRIHELKRQGTTMVFISHNLNAVQRICDRAILLNAGEVTAQGNVADVIHAYREQVVAKEKKRFSKSVGRATEQLGAATGVRITSVALRNGHRQVAESFETGAPLTVEIAVDASRPVERPVINVSLERLDGLVCHVATTRGRNVLPGPLHGAQVIRLTYPALNLQPNTYGVSVEITEEGRATPLESRKFVSLFSVTSDQADGGVVRLDHGWQVVG